MTRASAKRAWSGGSRSGPNGRTRRFPSPRTASTNRRSASRRRERCWNPSSKRNASTLRDRRHSVPAAQDRGPYPLTGKPSGEKLHVGRLPRAPHGQVPHAHHGAGKGKGPKESRTVHGPFPPRDGPDHGVLPPRRESSRATRAAFFPAAPRNPSNRLLARLPISAKGVESVAHSESFRESSAASRTSVTASPRVKISVISRKLPVWVPVTVGTPNRAGSRILCPPFGTMLPPTKAMSAAAYAAGNSPTVSRRTTGAETYSPPPEIPVFLATSQPCRLHSCATASNRSGWRGARRRRTERLTDRAAPNADSTAASSPSWVDPATNHQAPLSFSPRSQERKGVRFFGGGVTSNFMFPVTDTFSGSAPRETIRRASSSVCMAMAVTHVRTLAKRDRIRPYPRSERSEILPFTTLTGLIRLSHSPTKFGHISVSRIATTSGPTRSRNLPEMRGISKGKKNVVSTWPSSAFLATSCPVSVTVEKKSSAEGICSLSVRTSGIAERVSPTETAWIQILSFPDDA